MQTGKNIVCALCVALMLLSISCSQPKDKLIDNFRIDQTKNIMRPENFGIANGKITTGIQYKDLISIQGIWAPPYVSSDFSFQATINGSAVACSEYIWRPFYIERNAATQRNMAIETSTILMPEKRAFLVALTFINKGSQQISVPISFTTQGTLDKRMLDANWGFAAPKSSTLTTVKVYGNATIKLEQGKNAVVIAASKGIVWDDMEHCFKGNISLPASGEAKLFFSFSIGETEDATKQCSEIASNPEAAIRNAKNSYEQRVYELYQKVPRLESNNASLVHFYNRSLVPLLLNCWDVPEFKLKPYYSSGSVKGGCVGNYLWDMGEIAEIMSMYDPKASKAHIRQFLETGVKLGFGFHPHQWGDVRTKLFLPLKPSSDYQFYLSLHQKYWRCGLPERKVGEWNCTRLNYF